MKLCEPMDDDTDGQAHRASGRAVRADRSGERLGAGQRAGARDGRPALSRSRPVGEGACRAANAAAWLCAACCCSSPTCCCSTSRPTTSTPRAIDWLEQHLQQYKGTVIAVTHDRYFLDNVAGWILELDRGEGIPWKGNYSGWLDQKTTRMAMEEKQESKRRKTLERELEWVRMAPSARHAKAKARLAAYDKMLNEDAEAERGETRNLHPQRSASGRHGDRGAATCRRRYGDRVLYEHLNFSLPPAGIVGVIGPNGAGKTTLFRLIMGHGEADGRIVRGGRDREAGLCGPAAQVDRP